MKRKQFVVIGLGKFGSSVARTLYALDNDVLGVDSKHITHAVQADAADENS